MKSTWSKTTLNERLCQSPRRWDKLPKLHQNTQRRPILQLSISILFRIECDPGTTTRGEKDVDCPVGPFHHTRRDFCRCVRSFRLTKEWDEMITKRRSGCSAYKQTICLMVIEMEWIELKSRCWTTFLIDAVFIFFSSSHNQFSLVNFLMTLRVSPQVCVSKGVFKRRRRFA